MPFSAGHILKWTLAAAALSAAQASPPRFEGEFATTALASSPLTGPGAARESSRTESFTASLVSRHLLAPENWYVAVGAQVESFAFPGAKAVPRRLQDFGAVVALEYFQGDEPAAALTLHPGWYFERRPDARSLDAPFELISGVPLTARIQGVLGIGNGRFYHHPLPIFGLTTAINPRLRLQLVFPETAVIYTPRRGLSWRLRGELTGTGFRGDARAGRSAVEYTSYQVGLEFRRSLPAVGEVAISAGSEAARMFDTFHERQRWRGSGAFFVKFALLFSRS